MEKKKVHFSEKTESKVQQTLYKILSKYQYDFAPVNEYDNNNFYCYITVPMKNNFKTFFDKIFGWAGADMDDNTPYQERLKITASTNTVNLIDEYLVLSRIDIVNVIEELPENYIGNEEL